MFKLVLHSRVCTDVTVSQVLPPVVVLGAFEQLFSVKQASWRTAPLSMASARVLPTTSPSPLIQLVFGANGRLMCPHGAASGGLGCITVSARGWLTWSRPGAPTC